MKTSIPCPTKDIAIGRAYALSKQTTNADYFVLSIKDEVSGPEYIVSHHPDDFLTAKVVCVFRRGIKTTSTTDNFGKLPWTA